MLLDLGDHVDLFARRISFDPERVVDLRQVARLELDVDDRTDHLDDASDLLLLSHPCSPRYSASAPDTTSMISRVIAA